VIIEHGLVGAPGLRCYGKAGEPAVSGIDEGLAAEPWVNERSLALVMLQLDLETLASRLVRNATSRRFPVPSHHCTLHGLFLLRGRLVRDATPDRSSLVEAQQRNSGAISRFCLGKLL